jgi:helicase
VLLPDWINYRQSENTAAALARGLVQRPASWGELIATAQAIIGFYQEDEAWAQGTTVLYDEQAALPLIAAARVLDSAARETTDLPENERGDLSLLAAVAFSMYGNFLSAEAAIRERADALAARSSSAAAVIGTVAPSLIPRLLSTVAKDSKELGYLQQLEAFLYSGDEQLIQRLRDNLITCLINATTSLDSAMLRSCRLALEHVFTLSVARSLRLYCPELPLGYVQRLVDSGVRVLLPPQYRTIVEQGFTSSNQNALVALPTGTGKTLLGELALVASLGDAPGVGCYLSPYIALGHQVVQALRTHVGETVPVHPLMGGFRQVEALDVAGVQRIIVATPERMDGLLRTFPSLVQQLRCVVVDEAHIIESSPRGARVEGIVTRLRMLQSQGVPIRLVLMSAVLSSYSSLARWLGIPEEAVVRDTWRPTARRIATWSQSERLTWHAGDDPLRMTGVTPKASLGAMHLPWPEAGFYTPQSFGARRQQEPLVHKNVAYMARLLWDTYGAPVLCACSTRSASRSVAQAVADMLPDLEPLHPALAGVIERIHTNHPFLSPLAAQLRKGVAFHNASLPHEVRRGIEEAAKVRALRVVSSTTTLAEGTDLPFRFTILADWLIWQGENREPMPPLLFRNIVGRSGRPREFTEGDTIVFDNPLVEPREVGSLHPQAAQERLLFGSGPTELGSLLGRTMPGRAGIEVSAALASQILAAIPENPAQEDLATVFAQNTLAYHASPEVADKVVGVTRSVVASILDAADFPLATAASPLQLTAFGKASNATGFSPDSCRKIVSLLRQSLDVGPISSVAAHLLQEFAELPEQSSKDLITTVTRSKSQFCVKSDDFGLVAKLWVEGEDLENIFTGLPYVKKSSRVPSGSEWLRGTRGKSDWDAVYDRFLDFMKAAIQEFLPWLMRACGMLSDLVGGWGAGVPWRLWSGMLEHGVDSEWAVVAMDSQAPGGRAVVGSVGRIWPAEFRSAGDPLGIRALSNSDTQQGIDAQLRRLALGMTESERAQLGALRTWLARQLRSGDSAPG